MCMHQNRVVRLTSVSLFSILSAQNRIKYDRGVAVSVHGRIILLQNTPVFGSKGPGSEIIKMMLVKNNGQNASELLLVSFLGPGWKKQRDFFRASFSNATEGAHGKKTKKRGGEGIYVLVNL